MLQKFNAMKKTTIILGLLAGALLLYSVSTSKVEDTLKAQKDYIRSLGTNDSAESNAYMNDLLENKFSIEEINTIYTVVYAIKNKLKISEDLRLKFDIISAKYNIFT